MSRGGARLAGRVAGVLVVAIVGLLGSAGPSSAHATLVSSSPGNGTTLQSAPAEIVLHLSESVQLSSTRLSLTAGTGSAVPLAAPRLVRLGDAQDTESPVELVVALPTLAPDVYRLTWRTLSSDDLHTTSGVVVFGVQRQVAASSAAAPVEPRPGGREVVLRWAALLGTATLLGCFAVGTLLRPQDGPGGHLRRLRRRLARTALGAGSAALAADLGLLAVQARGPRSAWHLVTATGYGYRWLLLQAAVVALLLLAARKAGLGGRTGGAPLRPRQRWLLALGAVGVGLGTALTGHAAVAAAQHPVRVAVTAVHVVAAYLWVGSLVAVAVALASEGRPVAGAEIRPVLLRRFGALAAACVAVLACTGLLMAADQVATVDAALYSWYGRTLLLKTGLALAAGTLGLTSTLLLRPRWSELVLRRRVPGRWAGPLLAVESAVLVLVLGLAGALASEQPARGTAWTPVRASGPVLSATADDLVEQLSLSPNLPGRTFLSVGVYDSRRPAPARIDRVLVTLRSPTGRSVTRAAAQGVLGSAPTSGAAAIPDAWVVAGDDIAEPGPWQITVQVERSGLRDAVAAYTWVVPDGSATRQPVRVSDRQVGGILRNAALGLALALAAIVVALGLVRGPLRVPAPRPSESRREEVAADAERVDA